jgi:hypothetical protein
MNLGRPTFSKYSTYKMAAQILGISGKEMLELIRNGVIYAKQMGPRSYTVPLKDLRDYAALKPATVRGCITKRKMGWDLSRMISDAKKRAIKKKITFNLTDHDVREMFFMSEGKCSLTDLPFHAPDGEKKRYWKNPFAPSIDRIDNSLGYTPDNVRLVCVAMNLAMHQWGLEFFDELAEARRLFKKKWHR